MEGSHRDAAEAAVIALINAGNFGGAESRLRKMLADDGEDGRALALLAHCRLVADDDRQALDIARSAAALEPDDWMVRRVLLRALTANKKYEEADKVAIELLAEEPQDGSSLMQLAFARMNGKSLGLDAADIIAANELIDAAEENAGEDVQALISLAMWRRDQWRWDDAEALARRALTLDPTHAEVFVVLAECALAGKRIDEAFELALEGLRLEPGDRAVMRLLVRIKARRRAWLKPFLPLVDWIVEMDKRGLIGVPLVGVPVVVAWVLALGYDVGRVQTGQAPFVLFSGALTVVLLFGGVAYAVALTERLRIARDLKRVALPRF